MSTVSIFEYLVRRGPAVDFSFFDLLHQETVLVASLEKTAALPIETYGYADRSVPPVVEPDRHRLRGEPFIKAYYQEPDHLKDLFPSDSPFRDRVGDLEQRAGDLGFSLEDLYDPEQLEQVKDEPGRLFKYLTECLRDAMINESLQDSMQEDSSSPDGPRYFYNPFSKEMDEY
jgi:hypothetical protein